MPRFFIDRPIFACVISIVIMMAGILSIQTLPIERYPDIAPPTINISATYRGASAQTVENSVTQLLEQQIKGIDHILYFSSSSSSSGQARISVSFKQGSDPDTAQVQVQNSVNRVLNRLPQSVQEQGVVVSKSQGDDSLMVVGLYDRTGNSTNYDISDYLINQIQEPISRIDGVGETNVFGSAYAMRIWLNPQKLNQYGLMPSDIRQAVLAQNTQVTAGEIGAAPMPESQYLNAEVTAMSQLRTVDDFNQIIIKANAAGNFIYLKDVARVELGAENYQVFTRMNGYPASGMSVSLASGANALGVSDAVRDVMARLEPKLPAGFVVAYPRDSSSFVRESVNGVVKTLIEAIVLVVVVMFLFLQNWRSTLIPAIAVPIVVLGTFAILAVLGYSINTLTLFALVLAIGLLVDDAIVVVENVERVMRERQLSAKQATIESMQEITGAIIGITLVLTAVFIPMAFFGGSVGVIYRQFAVTIVAAMLLSALVALTITPALCASMLTAHHPKQGRFFTAFNGGLARLQQGYLRCVKKLLSLPVLASIGFVLIVGVLLFLYNALPSSFLPEEDQGALRVQYELPSGAPIAQTAKVADQIANYFMQEEKNNLNAIMLVMGRGGAGSAQNVGQAFVSLNDWSERKGVYNSADAIAQRANQHFKDIDDIKVNVSSPSAVRGLGNSSGFELWLRDLNGMGRTSLLDAQTSIIDQTATDPIFDSVRASSLKDGVQLRVLIDQKSANVLGVAQSDINSTLSSAWGGSYINDFIDRGRIKRVYMQGDQAYRQKPEDLAQWYVRSEQGDMVSFASFSEHNWEGGAKLLQRFNGVSALKVQGAAAQGYSSGAAMASVQNMVNQLPDVDLAWSGLSFEENASQNQTTWLYVVSIVFVFLCLAALYESWSIPAAVILVIPLGVVGAVLFTTWAQFSRDVYFQVALLVSIGLSCKNAILIVEFASAALKQGESVVQAALKGATLRLRPILMTSLAFAAGVLPLVFSTGAGAVSRQEIGVSVIGGMLFGTVLAVVYVPLFFVLIHRLFVPKTKC